jgi:hypothetical protein
MPNKLDQLCENVRRCIECFDKVMFAVDCHPRNESSRKIMNALQLELDLFERYYLSRPSSRVKKAKGR